MPSPDQLSSNTQKAVLDSLPAQREQNKKSALKNALWGAAGFAVLAVVPALPAIAVTIGGIVGATMVAFNGFKLLGNASRALSLHQIKSGVNDEKFVPKLKAKAGKSLQRASRLNNFSQKAFYVVVGAVIAASIPAVAPIAAIVYPVAMLGMLGSWAASDWNKGTAQATLPVAKLVYDKQVAEGAIRPAEDLIPPGAAARTSAPEAPKKSLGQSLADLFKRKSEKTAEKKLAPVPTAPKLAPPTP